MNKIREPNPECTCRIKAFQAFLHGGYSHASLVLYPDPNIGLPGYPALGIAVDSFSMEFIEDEKELSVPLLNPATGMLNLQYHMKDLRRVFQMILTGKTTITFTDPPAETGLVELGAADLPVQPGQAIFAELFDPIRDPVILTTNDLVGTTTGFLYFWSKDIDLPQPTQDTDSGVITLHFYMESLIFAISLLSTGTGNVTFNTWTNSWLRTGITRADSGLIIPKPIPADSGTQRNPSS